MSDHSPATHLQLAADHLRLAALQLVEAGHVTCAAYLEMMVSSLNNQADSVAALMAPAPHHDKH